MNTAAEKPGPTCDAAISLAPGRGATFTCHKHPDHNQNRYDRHRSIHTDLVVEWTDDHPKAFRRDDA